jgi:hypothetical protein
MKVSKKTSKILQEIMKWVNSTYALYTIGIFSILNLGMFLYKNNLNAVFFFILLGLIIYCYTKNMSIILIVCLVFTNLLFSVNTKEGMENEKDKKATTSGGTTSGGTTNDAVNNNVEPPSSNETQMSESSTSNTPTMNDKQNEISGFTTKSIGGGRLDAGATLEEAFNNLDKILGSDGVQKLSMDTTKLIENQANLFKTIERMSPLISKASDLIGGLSNKN